MGQPGSVNSVRPGPHAVTLRSRDGLVQSQLAAPEVLVAEGVVSEDVAALVDQAVRVRFDVRAPRDPLDRGVLRGGLLGREVPAGQHREQPYGTDRCRESSHTKLLWKGTQASAR
jgi:hypothetical protein